MELRSAIVFGGGVAGLEVAQRLHELAGPAGDLTLVIAGAGSLAVVLRKIRRLGSSVVDDVRQIRATTEEMPVFIAEQRETNARTAAAVERLEARAATHDQVLGVLGSVDRLQVAEAIERARVPPAA